MASSSISPRLIHPAAHVRSAAPAAPVAALPAAGGIREAALRPRHETYSVDTPIAATALPLPVGLEEYDMAAPVPAPRPPSLSEQVCGWFKAAVYVGTYLRAFAWIADHTLRNKYGDIQVNGMNLLTNPQGRFAIQGPFVVLFSHTSNDDGPLMGSQVNKLPLLADGYRCRPNGVMRIAKTWTEWFVTQVMFGRILAHLITKGDKPFAGLDDAGIKALEDAVREKKASLAAPASAERCTQEAAIAREEAIIQGHKDALAKEKADTRKYNEKVLRDQASQVLAQGEMEFIFPEGTTKGTGKISIYASGAVQAFAQHAGRPVPLVLATITYEPWVADGKPKVMVNWRKPVQATDALRLAELGTLLAETSDAAQRAPLLAERDARAAVLQRAMEVALSRLNTLTVSGILGAYLLEKRAAAHGAPVHVTLNELRVLLNDVLAQAHKDNTLCIDFDLQDIHSREARFRTAFARMVQEGFVSGNCANANAPLTLTDKLGPMADLHAVDSGDVDYDICITDPLRYWGNRTLQQASNLPQLRRILDAAVRHACPQTPARDTASVGWQPRQRRASAPSVRPVPPANV